MLKITCARSFWDTNLEKPRMKETLAFILLSTVKALSFFQTRI